MEQIDTSAAEARAERITAPYLQQLKRQHTKIVMVTAYDYPSAWLAERAGVDVVLVGDSVGTVVLGHKTVVPVTLDDIVHHVRAVRRGLRRSLLLADMPFGSYQVSVEEAIKNAVSLLKEGAQAIKLEGGSPVIETVRRMTEVGIPVMGHLGLTPQSVHKFGGHRVQGKEPESAQQILADAQALEAAGAIGMVLETIPAELAARVSQTISIPTIGIGAGPDCDGQVQVWHDMLGLTPGRTFRHVKRYAALNEMVEAALREYAHEVRDGSFPGQEHSL